MVLSTIICEIMVLATSADAVVAKLRAVNNFFAAWLDFLERDTEVDGS
jgi:hypothetical protein